ncbi:hypothetical protein HMPREF2942_00120 [Rothia sp. HMSC071C12]|uniref:replication protein RepA n=1 Tax=Rothia sp. HMSC071C12 TaxID=1739446 RepID=UPI0008A665A6|nr:replication protein RepA [Rothia sp. HMSC071C12]OFQ34093.1 hypothetical protein HMPREF2942_00120 [Rothia sp. HMSC071C12]
MTKSTNEPSGDVAQWSESSEDSRIAHYPETFLSFALPHRAPVMRTSGGEKTDIPSISWERHNGNHSLTMTAGIITTVDRDGTPQTERLVPYGKYSRILLHYLCTEAVKAGGPHISLATSYKGFLRDLGIPWSSRNAREVERQLRALLALTLQSTTVSTDADGDHLVHTINCVVGEEVTIAFSPDGNLNERKSQLVLSQRFYDQVVQRYPIPHGRHRWEQLVALTKSPLTLDIFLWLKHRLYQVEQGVPTRAVISWEALAGQFGADTSVKAFRKKFIDAAREIAEVDPNLIARVERIDQRGTGRLVRGIRLHSAREIGTGYKTLAD